MKVNDLVKTLQGYVDKYGEDLEVVVSSDEEGNSYSTITRGSVCECRTDIYDENAKVCGVIIYPWVEGFETPEEACSYDE